LPNPCHFQNYDQSISQLSSGSPRDAYWYQTVFSSARGTERQTDRQTDRETERQRDRKTARQRDSETKRKRDSETERGCLLVANGLQFRNSRDEERRQLVPVPVAHLLATRERVRY